MFARLSVFVSCGLGGISNNEHWGSPGTTWRGCQREGGHPVEKAKRGWRERKDLCVSLTFLFLLLFLLFLGEQGEVASGGWKKGEETLTLPPRAQHGLLPSPCLPKGGTSLPSKLSNPSSPFGPKDSSKMDQRLLWQSNTWLMKRL